MAEPHYYRDQCPGGHADDPVLVADPLARVETDALRCNRCGRYTWDLSQFGAEDRMTQPDGNPCGGLFGAA